MNKFFVDILKDLDGENFDIAKVLWAIGVLVYLILSIVSVIMGQAWNPTQYGIGFGAVLAGGGAAMGMRGMGMKTKSQNDQSKQES